MADDILYINGLAVSSGDVIKWPVVNESISYDESFTIPDSYTFEINNTNPYKYDPKYAGSILYDTQILKVPVSVYDGNLGRTTMRGVTTNVSTDSGSGKLTVECTSQLSALSDNDVQIVKTGLTPAEIAYIMMTSPLTLGSSVPLIDPSYIDYSSYRFCADYQKSKNRTCNITVYKGGDSNKKYSDVIPELNKIGHMYLYTHLDRIYFWQYTGTKNPSFIINNYKAGSYKDYYSSDEAFKIKNSYSVAYFNGANIAYASGKNLESINKYGESIFGIPTDDVNSNSSADFDVGIDNVTGAVLCGEDAMTRLSGPAHMCEFDLDYSYFGIIKVGDIVGLNFDAFSNTPVLILSASFDKMANIIRFVFLFL